MSMTDPNKSDVQYALKGIAATLAKKAAALASYADMVVEMSEEDFMKHLGAEYGGPGFLMQIQEQVAKAHDLRSSDTFTFERALLEVYSKAQREVAVGAASA